MRGDLSGAEITRDDSNTPSIVYYEIQHLRGGVHLNCLLMNLTI